MSMRETGGARGSLAGRTAVARRVGAWLRALVLVAAANLALAGAAGAAVIYSFAFTDPASGRLDAAGTFATGDAAASDPGFFRLTGLTFTQLRDLGTFTLNTGSLVVDAVLFSSPAFGPAYNPATGAFIDTGEVGSMNIGPLTAAGTTGPIDFGSTSIISGRSFQQAGAVNQLRVASQSAEALFQDLLTVTPQAVPEPAGLALFSVGALGLAALRRRTARAGGRAGA